MNGSTENDKSLSQRCSCCKKKKIIMVTCSCKKSYCLECRLPEVHSCKYDYVEKGKLKLLKDNPIVVAEKVIKI